MVMGIKLHTLGVSASRKHDVAKEMKLWSDFEEWMRVLCCQSRQARKAFLRSIPHSASLK